MPRYKQLVVAWCFLILQKDVVKCTRVSAVFQKQQGITFCSGCRGGINDEAEGGGGGGSHAPVWEGFHNPEGDFRIEGDIIYGVPNYGQDELYNSHHIRHNIALLDRGGGVSIYEKVRRAQDAGATAVLIVDTTKECSNYFEHCGTLGSKSNNGFVQQDGWHKWRNINIPIGLVHYEAGKRMKDGMDLIYMDLEGIGRQYMLDED